MITRGWHLAEVAGPEGETQSIEVSVIENIEQLAAELESHGLPDPDVLEGREIPPLDAGTTCVAESRCQTLVPAFGLPLSSSSAVPVWNRGRRKTALQSW